MWTYHVIIMKKAGPIRPALTIKSALCLAYDLGFYKKIVCTSVKRNNLGDPECIAEKSYIKFPEGRA